LQRHARWRRARTRQRHGRRAWHLLAKLAGAFRAARGGRAAWAFAVSNWVLKLGVVGALLAPLAALPPGAAVAAALGGELAAVLPVQAPAGVGTYEAGVVLGAQARRETAPPGPGHDDGSAGAAAVKADDNRPLIVGAALAVHALMVVVALATALAFSLIMRAPVAPESSR